MPWFFRSDVVALIADQEPVLLGYYSIEWFTLACILSAILLYVGLIIAFQTDFSRRQAFKFITVSITTVICVLAADVIWRMVRPVRYVEVELAERDDWQEAAAHLADVKRRCDERNVQLVIAYAPAKPHVLLPLVREALPAKKVREYVMLEESDVPPTAAFYAELFDRLDAKEQLLRAFCDEFSIPFISPTLQLREAMAGGSQVYYTYDQHWTHLGHDVVAEIIAERIAPMLESDEDD